MWQLRKQSCKKKSEAPVAKKNEKGELVTESSQLKKLYETTYNGENYSALGVRGRGRCEKQKNSFFGMK